MQTRVRTATSSTNVARVLVKLFKHMLNVWHFYASVVLMILATLLSSLIPYIMRYIIDAGIVRRSFEVILNRSSLLIALAAVSSLFRLGSGYVGSLATQRVVHMLRASAFESMLRKPVRFFSDVAVGQAITTIVNDTGRVEGFLAFEFRMLINAVFSAAISVVFMFYMNASLALVALASMAATVIVNAYTASALRPVADRFRQQLGNVASIATGDIAGIKTVKGLGLEKLESKKFEESNSRLLDIGVSMARRRAVLTNANALIFGLATSTILLYGGFATLRGEISVGDLVAFMSYMAMLMWPLSMLGLIIANIQTVSVSARRIFELIESGVEEDDDNCVELNNVSGEVVFENVSFGYTENSPVLKNLNLVIKPGERVVIVGKPGSGKSALLKIIPKLYRVSSGRVIIDDTDIERVCTESLRKHIAYVPQEPFIFSGTIAENIAFGNPNATVEDIIRAAKAAKIDSFVESLPDKYNTVVGERGLTLSGGQRQRIAIARALVRNPKILLLDDPTSNLDAETEKELLRDLTEISKGRTIIIATQRPTVAAIADRVVVLDSGCVAEEGAVSELLQRRGLFYRMFTSMVSNEGEVG
uniref:ABC transporter ATP-binding protein n=1 Tax=Ignisphaera aggregans TaxID=334771 RepID=A0A7J3Z5I9_9CREN